MPTSHVAIAVDDRGDHEVFVAERGERRRQRAVAADHLDAGTRDSMHLGERRSDVVEVRLGGRRADPADHRHLAELPVRARRPVVGRLDARGHDPDVVAPRRRPVGEHLVADDHPVGGPRAAVGDEAARERPLPPPAETGQVAVVPRQAVVEVVHGEPGGSAAAAARVVRASSRPMLRSSSTSLPSGTGRRGRPGPVQHDLAVGRAGRLVCEPLDPVHRPCSNRGVLGGVRHHDVAGPQRLHRCPTRAPRYCPTVSSAADVEVLVVSYNSADTLDACLASVEAAAPGTPHRDPRARRRPAARERLAAHRRPAPDARADRATTRRTRASGRGATRSPADRTPGGCCSSTPMPRSSPGRGAPTTRHPSAPSSARCMVDSGHPGVALGRRLPRPRRDRAQLVAPARSASRRARLRQWRGAADRPGVVRPGRRLRRGLLPVLRGHRPVPARQRDRLPDRRRGRAGRCATAAPTARGRCSAASLVWSYESAVRFHARHGHPVAGVPGATWRPTALLRAGVRAAPARSASACVPMSRLARRAAARPGQRPIAAVSILRSCSTIL